MRYELLIPPILLVLVIIIFLTLGFYFYFRTRKKVKYWHRAKGIVTELVAKGWGSGHRLYSPKVRFTASGNKEVEFVESWQSHPPRFKIGEEVTILYNPQNFNQACVLMPKQIMYYPGWLFLLLGGVFLFFGTLIAVIFGIVFYFLGAPGQK